MSQLMFISDVDDSKTNWDCYVARFKVLIRLYLKLHCDSRFQRVITACSCVFKVITLVGSNQCNFFENATACSKRTLKTTVATQLKHTFSTNYLIRANTYDSDRFCVGPIQMILGGPTNCHKNFF